MLNPSSKKDIDNTNTLSCVFIDHRANNWVELLISGIWEDLFVERSQLRLFGHVMKRPPCGDILETFDWGNISLQTQNISEGFYFTYGNASAGWGERIHLLSLIRQLKHIVNTRTANVSILLAALKLLIVCNFFSKRY